MNDVRSGRVSKLRFRVNAISMVRCGAALTALMLLGSCASQMVILPGTRSVREVVHLLTRQEILTGELAAHHDTAGREPIRWPNLHRDLLAAGFKDAALVDGSIILGRTRYYWNNVTSGVVRQVVRPSFAPREAGLTVGNIVEVEISGRFSTVVATRYASAADGKCEYRQTERGAVSSALAAINPVGGPGARWLYCPELERAGWHAYRNDLGFEWFDRRLISGASAANKDSATLDPR